MFLDELRHAGECVSQNPAVLLAGEVPWCQDKRLDISFLERLQFA